MAPKNRIIGVVPARYASTRLPGKPLVDIGGKSMLRRVVEQASRATSLMAVVVATDDARIAAHVGDFGGQAVMTRPDHASGTDRCAEALRTLGLECDAVVNIQGDEPFIAPAQIDEVCAALVGSTDGIATLAQVVTNDSDLDDAGEVLITVDHGMDALYFSRTAIPHLHLGDGPRHQRFRFLKHVGLYAFRTNTLHKLVALPPSPLELAEGLEQLRWMENGFRVRIGITDHPSYCVDTPADLEEARRRVREQE